MRVFGLEDAFDRAAQGRGKGVIKELNLFTGFVWSGLDGSRMILRQSGVKSRKTGRYVWHSYLVSTATIAGQSAHSHRIGYSNIEERMVWLMGNLDPKMMARVRTGAHNDTSDRIAATERQIQAAEKQVTKFTRLILADDDPSAALVAELKAQEAELKSAKAGLETLQLSAAKTTELPKLPNAGDLSNPETRRALRKEISRWCTKIEVFADYMIVWFNERYGIMIPLVGPPCATYHDLDHLAVERAGRAEAA